MRRLPKLQITKNPLLYLQILTILIISNRLRQFSGVIFVSPDDTFTAAAGWVNHGILNAAVNQAKSQGRFYQVIYYWLAQLPYRFIPYEYYWVALVLQMLILAVLIFMVSFLLSKNKIISLMVVALFFSIFDFRGAYNSISTFPLWFCFAINLLMISLILQNRAIKAQKFKNIQLVIAFALCCIASLAYESYLFFPILFYYITKNYFLKDFQSYNSPELQVASKSRKYYLNILRKSIFLFYFIYMLLYLSFRLLFPSNYAGTQVTFSNPWEMIVAIHKYTFAGFSYIPSILSNYSYLYIFCAFLIFLVIVPLDGAIRETIKLNIARIWIILAIPFFITAPNILYGITSRYRHIAETDPMYLGALPSGITLFIILGYFFGKISKPKRRAIFFVLVPIIGIVSVHNNSSIENYTKVLKVRTLIWNEIDSIIPILAQSENQVNILAPSLLDQTQTPESYQYWDFYLSSKSKRKVSVVSSQSAATEKIDKIQISYISGQPILTFTKSQTGINTISRKYESFQSKKCPISDSKLRLIGANKLQLKRGYICLIELTNPDI